MENLAQLQSPKDCEIFKVTFINIKIFGAVKYELNISVQARLDQYIGLPLVCAFTPTPNHILIERQYTMKT